MPNSKTRQRARRSNKTSRASDLANDLTSGTRVKKIHQLISIILKWNENSTTDTKDAIKGMRDYLRGKQYKTTDVLHLFHISSPRGLAKKLNLDEDDEYNVPFDKPWGQWEDEFERDEIVIYLDQVQM